MGHSNCDKCGHDKRMCECDKGYVAQEGGDHYQAEYQHWDWVIDMEMPYLPACATKYVTRWWKKNGLQDLEKAMTYIDKNIANYAKCSNPNFKVGYRHRVCTDNFLAANNIAEDSLEGKFCIVLSGPRDMAMLRLAKEYLTELIRLVRAGGTGQGGKRPAGQGQEAAGRAGGRVGQGAASSASSGRSHGSADGMEHPFGYDAWHEGEIT